MGKPAIQAVDDDPEVSAAISRDLQRRYSGGCRLGEGAMSVCFAHRYLATI
jgi:hypothetical protein